MSSADARRLRVALLIETSNRYGRDLLHGVHDWVTAGAKWSIRLTEQSRLAPLPGWLRSWDGDGIIARVDSASIAAALRRLGRPVVDVSAERARSEFPRVSIDNAVVARLAAEHLVAKNLPNFAFCGDPRFLWSRERARYFASILRATGRRCHSHGVTGADPAPVDSEAGMQALTEWVAALPKPVGIFACYDARALQVLTACQHLSLKVPSEVALLGVDNDEVLCELCDPPLSSILPNARRAGYEAAVILHRLMTDPGRRPADSLAIEPVRVVERLSTDALGASDPAVAAAVQFIRTHACDGVNMDDVLRRVPVSRTLLERKFKQQLGQTPHRMITAAKIARARELLTETDLPIARIADLAGFQSATYLSAAFRRETGRSPLDYRRGFRVGRNPRAGA